MQDKDRERRRQRRLEKTRKKRADVSRPGLGGPATATDVAKGKGWPIGECFASMGWDEPGARVELVFSRSRPDGATALAEFEIDRSGPGLVAARAVGGARREHVAGACARLSERTGRALVACSPGLVAALVREAAAQGHNPAPAGFRAAAELLDGVPDAEIGSPFGSQPASRAKPARSGWPERVRRWLFGG